MTFAAIAATLLWPAVAAAQIAFAVTESNTLVRFELRAPGAVTTVGPIITSPTAGTQIVALDFRPADGQLVGVGNDGRMYYVNPGTAQATHPQFHTPLAPFAGSKGVDFDPRAIPSTSASERPGPGMLHVVSDEGLHVRVHDLGSLGGAQLPTWDISAIAFAPNRADTDRRTLFGIDHSLNALVRIGDADTNGDGYAMVNGSANVIGPLNVDAAADIGFDITAHDNVAYATMAPVGAAQSTLYRINLQTGSATALGAIAAGGRVRGLAILERPVAIYVLTAARELVTIDSGATNTLLNVVQLSPGPGAVLSIDARPATGDLYGLTNAGHLVTIDPASGLVRPGAAISGVTLTGTRASIDFNPLTDRLHVVTDTGQHVSINPDTGVAAAEPLSGAAGVTSIAFTDNRADAVATTLLALNTTTDQFGRIDNPTTTGAFTPIGPIGMDVVVVSTLDVSAADGVIFAAVRGPLSSQAALVLIDPYSGAMTGMGIIPATITVEDIAIASPGRVRFARPAFAVSEHTNSSNPDVLIVERTGDVSGPVTVTVDLGAGGTATGGADYYDIPPMRITFASGERTRGVSVPVLDDTIDEPDETINFVLRAPEGGATITTPSATVLTIVDDDTPSLPGSAPTVRITQPDLPTVSTGSALVAATTPYLSIVGTVFDLSSTLTAVRWANDRGFNGAASIGPSSGFGVGFTIPGLPLLPGLNIITVSAEDAQGHTNFTSLAVTLDELQYVFAEGALGAFFDTDLLLANPNLDIAPVKIEYLRQGGGKATRHEFIPARSRRTIAVDELPELAGVGEVSMVVTADPSRPIAAERTMRWGDGRYGSHTDKATSGAQRKWYFAEGSQGTFATYILLANPNAVGTVAKVTFLQESDTTPNGMPQTSVVLPPFSRFTLDAGVVPNVPGSSFGILVEFTGAPGVAERAMYFSTDTAHWIGGHESAGVTEPSHEWYLAEGATGSFFTTFVLLANPHPTPANVDVTYFPAVGSPVHKPSFVLAGNQRLTINLALEDPSLADAAIATRVVADAPILVERAQYWPNPFPRWYEAHNSFGVTALGTRWGLAEGRVGGPESYQTYILLANPGTTDAEVTVTFLRETGAPLEHVVTVPAGRRFNVAVDGAPGGIGLHDERFGALITSTQAIAVERALYGNATGQLWQMGTNAVGTRLPQ